MTDIYLTNSLSRKLELFTPIDAKNVRFYACGPTVYDRAHLGNARAAVVYDLLFRLLKACYPKVTYVRNITDVDDKIITACQASGEEMASLTQRYVNYFHEDMAALNCLSPSFEPKATEYIVQMIAMIEELIAKDFAYFREGHVLFRVNSYAGYGLLSRRSVDEMIMGARVEVAPYKEDPMDFVLWKPAASGEEKMAFASPWGKGRPGWHIECSAMSKALLSDTFDIHGGGADLMFPHHENELAQSCCANKTNFMAKFWIHNGFLTVDGEKMSKSLGNFKTVRELIDDGVDPMVIRLMYLSTHYRKPFDFNDKLISDCTMLYEKLQSLKLPEGQSEEAVNDEVLKIFASDLNTPGVIAYLHEKIKEVRAGVSDAAHELLSALSLVGIKVKQVEKADIPNEIITLANARKTAKEQKNWQEADNLRQQILTKGYNVVDLPNNDFEITLAK
jgi:cysteinyl-tRNA synthetase